MTQLATDPTPSLPALPRRAVMLLAVSGVLTLAGGLLLVLEPEPLGADGRPAPLLAAEPGEADAAARRAFAGR